MEPFITAGAKSLVSALTRKTVVDLKDKKLGSAFEAEVYRVAEQAWRSATVMASDDQSVDLDELGILVANALGLDGAGEALLISTFDDSRPFDFARHPVAGAKFEDIYAEHLGLDPRKLFQAFRTELRRFGHEAASKSGSTLTNLRLAGGLQTIEDLVRQGQAVQPAGPSMPIRFNLPKVTAHFQAREPELAALEQALDAEDQVLITQSISGLGGVGKTQIAAQYLHQHLEEHNVVAWIRSETSPVADLAAFADRIDPQPSASTPPPAEERASFAKGWLEQQSEHRWLLVFDNVDDPVQIAQWAPSHGKGRVLVTSRLHDLSQFGKVLTIDVFDDQTGAAYLIDTTGRRDEQGDALALTRALGGLPLALSHAAAYCRTGISLGDYLKRLNKLPAQKLFKTNSEAGYRQTIAATWRVSIQAAEKESHGSKAVLAMAAHLAPEAIPRHLLSEALPKVPEAERAFALDEALRALAGYSLIALTDTLVDVHRLLQKVVRDAPGKASAAGATAAGEALLKAFPGNPESPETWPECRALIAHLIALLECNPPRDRLDRLLTLANRGVRFLHASGQIAATVALAESYVRLTADLSDDDQRQTARAWLASSYHSAGRTAEAIPIQEQVVADSERVLGPDHPDAINARNNLANSYQSAGRTAEAIPIQEQVVADRERILGPDHPDTITPRANLANSYRSAGRTAEAIPINEQVVADFECILGPDHPDTIRARANLAGSYQSAGRTAEAIPIQEQVVADRERILGPDHPDTITARANLALSYWSAGRTAQAIPINEQVVADRERILGADHPDTITARANLALSYWSAGRTAQAIPIKEQVVADRERILGPDHPNTITARANLALSYWSAGRTAEAIPIDEQVVADYERILGPDHPDTITARGNLAIMRAQS